MSNCIFCQIVSNEAPAYKIYEDEHFLAFLTIEPVSAGHTLVIPKQHFENVLTMPDNDLDGYLKVVKTVAQLLKDKLPCPALNILSAQGKESQQSVFHQHFHLIPRHHHDGLDLWFHHKLDDRESLKRTHEILTA